MQVEIIVDSEEYAYKECDGCDKVFDINSTEIAFELKMKQRTLLLCCKCRKDLLNKLAYFI